MVSPNFEDEVHWVRSSSPPAQLRTILVPGMSQLFIPMNMAFIIPGPLDASRFRSAVSSWLTLVPSAAGRLFRADDLSWTVKLSESYSIPVTFSSYEDPYTDEQLYNTFQPLLDPIPWTFWPPEDVETHPLTRFKVTNMTRTGETAITIHMCHVLADGFSMLRVLNILSDLYCGASVSEQMPATFETYVDGPPPFLDPSGEAYTRALLRLPNFSKGYAPHDHFAKWKEYTDNTELVNILFSKKQIGIILRRANATLPANAERVFTADVIPAYVFTVLNRAYGSPKFNRILTVLGTRGQLAPRDAPYKFPPVSAMGVGIVQTVSEPFPHEHLLNLSALASHISSYNRAVLKPDVLLDLASVTEQRQLDLNQEGKIPWLLADGDDGVLCSSLLHKASIRIHFGYGADRSRFMAFPVLKHYVRVFKANPIRHSDGTWEDREGAVQVIFLVEKGIGEKVRALVQQELESWSLEERQQAQSKL